MAHKSMIGKLSHGAGRDKAISSGTPRRQGTWRATDLLIRGHNNGGRSPAGLLKEANE